MAERALSKEEAYGLGFAVLAHVGLVALLVAYRPAPPPPPPERMTVTLSDTMGQVSTSPDPQANPAPDKGSDLGEPAPTPPEPAPAASPEPAPLPPRPTVAPAKASPKPPQQVVKPPSKWPFAPPQQTPKAAPAKSPPPKAGTSQFDNLFGKGIPGGSGKDKTPPASQASAQVSASWDSSIKAKVQAQMRKCTVSGLDVNKLTATVHFTLDKGGRVQSIEDFSVGGITDTNRPQSRPFKDCIIRAITTASPYTGMPEQYYDQWKARKINFGSGRIG